MNRLREEMKLIPRAAWGCAVAICLGVPLGMSAYWVLSATGPRGFLGVTPPELLIFIPILSVLFFYILLIGYIAKDARRRGMPVLLWTLLAMFIPSAIGIILYFILRQPLLRACNQCGATADAAYTFCPSCGATLGKTCPSCRNSVESSWSHCARCGAALATT